jgi:hypothetical protein
MRGFIETYGSTIWNAFQDYMPNILVLNYIEPSLQHWITWGSPSYADPYLYQNRLNDYRRVMWFPRFYW